MAEEKNALDEALKAAAAALAAMSPVDKALHDDQQRRSFIRGQCGRDPGPSVLAEEVRRLQSQLSSAQERIKKLERENASLRTSVDRYQAGDRRAVRRALTGGYHAAHTQELRSRITSLEEALRPFSDAFEQNSTDGPCLTEADVRGMHNAVDVQDFRRARSVLQGER